MYETTGQRKARRGQENREREVGAKLEKLGWKLRELHYSTSYGFTVYAYPIGQEDHFRTSVKLDAPDRAMLDRMLETDLAIRQSQHRNARIRTTLFSDWRETQYDVSRTEEDLERAFGKLLQDRYQDPHIAVPGDTMTTELSKWHYRMEGIIEEGYKSYWEARQKELAARLALEAYDAAGPQE